VYCISQAVQVTEQVHCPGLGCVANEIYLVPITLLRYYCTTPALGPVQESCLEAHPEAGPGLQLTTEDLPRPLGQDPAAGRGLPQQGKVPGQGPGLGLSLQGGRGLEAMKDLRRVVTPARPCLIDADTMGTGRSRNRTSAWECLA